MDKLNTIKELLVKLKMPSRQQGKICCLTLLAMAGLKRTTPWKEATNEWIRIHDVITFISDNYDVAYAENSRETFRKEAMHPFRTAALIEDNGEATNSPKYRYRLTQEFLNVIRAICDGDEALLKNRKLSGFLKKHGSLSDKYASKRKMNKMPVRINGSDFTFSPGKHNSLQKAIIEEFAPRFAPNSECLYVGDTIKKDLVKNEARLAELGFEITLHDKMPDVVLYREDRDWIYFIETVTSVGPMSPERILDIEVLTKESHSGRIYITAFLDFATYKRFSSQLAWETDVWIAEMPDHMIHLNGDKFLGPYNTTD